MTQANRLDLHTPMHIVCRSKTACVQCLAHTHMISHCWAQHGMPTPVTKNCHRYSAAAAASQALFINHFVP
jgi:hypothetical protein